MSKKIILIVLAAMMAFTAVSCDKKNSLDLSSGEIEFWSTYATEKVLQDRPELYDDIKKTAVVEVAACKGEYESTQLIMTAKSAVSRYDVELFDLTGESDAKFDKNNICVSHEKYMPITETLSNASAPKGMYPDALVPFENIKKAGENKIAANENQGLYITFNVPLEQPEGNYTGSMRITYDGKEKDIPVKLEVYDLEVSAVTHSKSYFNNMGFSLYQGELDSSQNMVRKYNEKLLEYRISPSTIMHGTFMTRETAELYIDEALDLVNNHGMSTINLPYKEGDNMARLISVLAERCLRDNKNYMDMVIVKGPDEPDLGGGTLPASFTAYNKNFKAGIVTAKSQVSDLKNNAEYKDQSEFIDSLLASIDKIPSIITTVHGRNEALDAAGSDTYCPYFSQYDDAANRVKYENGKEKWWYGCVGPRPPYPTYHIDDTLISARAVSWMMSEYDIVGNLYWATAVYAKYDHASHEYKFVEDCYGAPANRYPGANGDGYLFYPGFPYGIDGPVPSIRLEAIRDGNEEYEILLDMRNTYAALGQSPDAIQHSISSLIYSGAKVKSTNEDFASARKMAIQLTCMAKSSAGVCITDVIDDDKGNLTYKIFAKEGFEIKNNGAVLKNGQNVDGGILYTLNVKLDKDDNAMVLSVNADGKEYKLDINPGGKVSYYEAEDILDESNKFTSATATAEALLENGKVKLVVGAVKDSLQSVRYASLILSTVDKNTKKFTLYIENPTQEEISFNLLSKFEKNALNVEIYGGTLKPGLNEVEVFIGGFNLELYGKLLYTDFFFEMEAGNHDSKTIYITGLVVSA